MLPNTWIHFLSFRTREFCLLLDNLKFFSRFFVIVLLLNEEILEFESYVTNAEFTFTCPSKFSDFPTALQGCRERAVAAALLYFALVKLRCQNSHPPATSDPTTRLTRSNMPERSPLNHWRKRKWFDLIWFCHCCVPSLLLFFCWK